MARGKNLDHPITAACLFAGMGGFAAGLKQAGVTTRWANEEDRHACKTFCHNHPETRMLAKDVRKLSVAGDSLLAVDILTAGFPCQSFSVAGHKRGFDDERGKLFYQIIRLIKEFGNKKPKVLLMENVPNLLHGNGGRWFDSIISEVQFAGYWFDSRSSTAILNTASVSHLPQNRNRLFMVAFSTDVFQTNGFKFPQANGQAHALSCFIDKSRKANKSDYLPVGNRYYEYIKKKIEAGKTDSVYNLRRYYVRENRGKCPTLTANMGGGGHNVPFVKDRWGIRRLTVKECAMLQGFKAYKFPLDMPLAEQYRQIGNAVSVPVVAKLGKECVRLITLAHAEDL